MKADKKKISRLLKTARGQIDGVLKMIDEEQYCIDIANQILAAEAILRKTTREVLKAHLEGCVTEALGSDDEQVRSNKVDEFVTVIEKIAK